jgi:hypothetical protein
MAEQLVSLRLFTGHFDTERRIGETLHDNADEFNDVLRHRERRLGESRRMVRMQKPSDKGKG